MRNASRALAAVALLALASGSAVAAPVYRGSPPPIEVSSRHGEVTALQGSYCWDNGCADMAYPRWRDLPRVGRDRTVDARFDDPGATWSVWVTSGRARCATYPVLLTPSGDGYELTPSGPGGPHRAEIFVQPDSGGDTSGSVRWNVVPAAEPTSWAHLHQNSPNEGGGAQIRVVLDGAAVDGQASHGSVTVTAADGESHRFRLPRRDVGCAGDRYVSLATGYAANDAIDDLGDGPFTYDVDVVVGGTHHHATATSADGAEDTPLTFEPALPE